MVPPQTSAGPVAADSTPARLLDATERLIGEHGINGVSVRAINAAADSNVAAAHYHFGSKEGLVAAALSAVGRGPVALRGMPPPPAAGGVPAGGATVPGLGPLGQEPALAALEEAAAAAVRPGAGTRQSLTGRAAVGILQRAHGR